MSLRTRLLNAFRGDRLNREIDEEFQSHIDEAIENGASPAEARKAFGSLLRQREASRDVRLSAHLDSLRADAVFGWRQMMRHKITSAAAILSLALAIGSCTAAFRLIDAILLRPLPVSQPDRIFALNRYAIAPDGQAGSYDSFAYPDFQQMRAAVKGSAELLAVSYTEPADITFKSDAEMEKAKLQYVSGWMFGTFGLRPAAGRLFTERDDEKPGGHPYAVISWDYWSRRFGRDPKVIGQKFRMGNTLYEVCGVGPEPFTGTDRGTVTDVFVPTMMHPGATKDDWTWFRILARLQPGVAIEPVRARLDAASRAFEERRAQGFSGMSRTELARILDQTLMVEPENAAASGLQHEYRPALQVLGILVALVLLIACANVADLMTAQAASRAREMALRVSIGAGRARLLQLVLVESAMVALLAAVIGTLFAWWAAPFVVSRINPPDNPARLLLQFDWRVMAFGLALTLLVALLFGLIPALRASAVKPASALKGGDDPHSRRRLMHSLVALQVAFCFVVLFVAGLFVTTLDRLSRRPIGFSTERLLTLDTAVQRPQPAVLWDQVADHLRALPGVQSVAISNWALLGGGGWNGYVSINGAPPSAVLAFFLGISPNWLDTMKIELVAGRDFRPEDTFPGAAIVNETFVKQFLPGQSPLGKTFAKGDERSVIVGVVRDSPYAVLRYPISPVAYVPMHNLAKDGSLRPIGGGTFIVRTRSENPITLAGMLRRGIPAARPEFRVSTIRTQAEIVEAQTVRERLLAMLGLFFALVALLLASVGLYGVLDYSVLQRRREIGIRMAIGARAAGIVRLVTTQVFVMIIAGAIGGLGLGLFSARYIKTLLYDVAPTDSVLLAAPLAVILTAAAVAAIPAVLRAVRVDPAKMLRSE